MSQLNGAFDGILECLVHPLKGEKVLDRGDPLAIRFYVALVDFEKYVFEQLCDSKDAIAGWRIRYFRV